jgi:predicted dehydrogenase
MRRAGAAAAVAGGLTILGAGPARGQAAKTFKVGLIGCGGRGNGAAGDILNAAKALNVDVRFTALADAYADRVTRAREALKGKGQEVPEAQCFTGFDAYKKLIAADVDIVLMCTSPNFRPMHFEAAVKAGKHVFIEKPVAVDPVGCRRVLATGEEAGKKGLAVLAGTCLRHDKLYRGFWQLISDGTIGRVLGGVTYYCIGRLWCNPRKEGWSDAEYLVRNWANFAEMSGDHIVEQHVHTLDMVNWCLGAAPVAAVAVGGRARRVTGNQFDFFSTDLEYPDQVHIHSICRQVNGCWDRGNGFHLVGEKGWAEKGWGDIRDGVFLWDGKRKVPYPDVPMQGSMYIQEHVVFLDSILKGKPVNDTKAVTEASLTAILARMSAYTGARIEWKELAEPNVKPEFGNFACKPTPEDFEKGEVKAPEDDVVPIPGKA